MDETEKKRCWIGFDLGGTKMLAVVFDAEMRPIGRKRRKTKGNEGAKAGIERIVQTIRDALEDAGRPASDVAGIGIGAPGYIDLDRGTVIDASNLGWKNVHIRDVLQKEFGCPAVLLNDVDAGVYGEYRFGAGKGERCVIGIFPGTGIGGGCVYEGQIIRGKTQSCFEIGHVQVTQHGLLCGCGRNGCLETEASRLAISAAAAIAAFRGEAPHLLAAAGTNLNDIRSSVLADSIKAGDTSVEAIVRRASMFIGDAVGNVVNLLAPDVVILGGGMIEAMPELMVKTIEASARKRAAPCFAKTFKVVAAKLGDEAVARGAAGWAERSAAIALAK